MKKLLFPAALAIVLFPMIAAAQSAFDGTWKIDMSKVNFPKNRTFTCCRMARMSARRALHLMQ